jgi:hypothetical protein
MVVVVVVVMDVVVVTTNVLSIDIDESNIKLLGNSNVSINRDNSHVTRGRGSGRGM